MRTIQTGSIPVLAQFVDGLTQHCATLSLFSLSRRRSVIWQLAFINGADPRVGESGLGLIGGHTHSRPMRT